MFLQFATKCYQPIGRDICKLLKRWWTWSGSNRRPLPLQAVVGAAQIVFACRLLQEVTANEFWAVVLTLAFLGLVSCWKHSLKIRWVLVEFRDGSDPRLTCV